MMREPYNGSPLGKAKAPPYRRILAARVTRPEARSLKPEVGPLTPES